MSDADNVVDLILGQSNTASNQAIAGMEDTPDDAVKAIQLSKTTGVPASAVMGDLPEFEASTKRKMASDIIRSNRHLTDYVNADPMHSRISSDDYGNLDTVSSGVERLVGPGRITDAARLPASVLGQVAQGFKEGFGSGNQGSWMYDGPGGADFVKNYPMSAAALATVASPVELTLRSLSGIIKGGIEGFAKGAEGTASVLGADPMTASRIGREAGALGEFLTTDPAALAAVHHNMGELQKGEAALQKAKPWIDQGLEPPAGLDPMIDKIKVEQNNLDLKNLDAAMKEAQKSATRERDPDIFASFIAQHTDAKIGISGDAVAKLYGDKIPEAGDNILGWSPGIVDELRAAIATGGDVQVPLSDWLAKADPEIAKALHDDIRVRPGGITKAEKELMQDYEPSGVINEPLPSSRAANGLEPMFSIGDRKLELKRITQANEENIGKSAQQIASERGLNWDDLTTFERERIVDESQCSQFGRFGNFHDFSIVDEAGKDVGTINLSTQKDGKQLYIEMINGINGRTARDFGPALMRDLLRQLKEQFPEAETITGHRVSGARDKAGSFDKPSAMPVVKFEDLLDPIEYAKHDTTLRDMFDGKWEKFSQYVEAYVRPSELWTKNELAIADIVHAELDRIVPKQVAVTGADKIRRDGERDRGPIGTYLPYRDAFPTIIWSLESKDAIGTARHEAIHHLRQYGFYDAYEWGTLTRAARDQGWLDKFNIDRRYPDLDMPAKLEEAIAEGFRDWMAQGSKADTPLGKLFERLKEFLDAIKEKVKALIGRDPTWEELFGKTDRGEIGNREGNVPIVEGAYREQNIETIVGPAAKLNDQIFIDKTHGLAAEQAMNSIGKTLDNIGDVANFDGEGFLTSTGRYVSREDAYKLATESGQLTERTTKYMGGRQTLDTIDLETEKSIRGIEARDGKFQMPDEPPTTKMKQAELPGLTRMEDRDAFEKANAIGMTVDQYKRYMKLIEKRNIEDIEATTKRAEAIQRRSQSAEWKENRKAMHAEVSAEMQNRPDVAADSFFADGKLYGEKLGEKPKLNSELLTEAQREALPKDMVSKDGMHPDDVAGLFGYKSGAEMVASMSRYNEARKQAGMSPKDFLKRITDIETDRQMVAKYGDLEKNILEEVKDQVTSQTQLDLLHEETHALALQAGAEFPIKQQDLKTAAQDGFARSIAADQKTDRYLAAAGKAGKAAEMALLKGDFAEAFREKQRQYYAMIYAREAKALEKAQASFDKMAKRYSKREVKGVDQDFVNFSQALLQGAELPVARSQADLTTAMLHSGYQSLGDFVSVKNSDGWDLTIGPELQAGRITPFEKMTVEQFYEFKDAITSLNHVGREVNKINIAGEKRDFAEWKAGVVENITQLPVRPADRNGKNWFYKFDAMSTRMEEIVKDLDLRQELGPLFNAVIRPMMMAKSKEYELAEKLTKDLKSLKGADKAWQAKLKDTIPQDFFVDPYDGVPVDMTRENMIQVMLNWGNEGNKAKFSRGYGSPELNRVATKEEGAAFQQKMQGLIDRHATKADWDYVQAIWDLFKGWQKDADTVYRNTSGVAPRWVENQPVETPHGVYDGGYYPIIYDKIRSNIGVIQDRSPPTTGTLSPDYYRASTSKGYTKDRTGYTDRIDFSSSLESVAMRMQQMIHDISYREAMIDVGKVLYDKEIRGAIRKHYGKEYEDQLVPWLKRIANNFNQDDVAMSAATAVMRRARINLVAHALPLNLKVFFSPDAGVFGPGLFEYMSNRSEMVKLAMEKSNEIPHTVYNMDRDFREGLERTIASRGWTSYQAEATRWGFMPVVKLSQDLRTITFYNKYTEALGKNMSEIDAAAFADSFVRERHGAASIADLPAIMQSSEAMKTATMFYGFFNTMYNWQRQIVGNVRRGEWKNGMTNFYGAVFIPAMFGAVLFNQQREGDSWFKVIAKAMVIQPLSTLVFARDLSNMFLEGFSPRTPITTVMNAVGSIVSDAKKFGAGKKIEKPIQHTANVLGLGLGVPGMAQAGRTGQFAYDVAKGVQKPRNIQEWTRGIIQGEARLKK